MTDKPRQGWYEGIFWSTVIEDGSRNVVLNLRVKEKWEALGANVDLLKDVGTQKPEDVLRKMLESIPQPKQD